MLSHENIIKFLALSLDQDRVTVLQEFLALSSNRAIKHPALNKALAEPDAEVRRAAVANLLYHTPGFFESKAADENLTKIFFAFEQHLRVLKQENFLVLPADIRLFYATLLKQPTLSAEARKICQALGDVENIFDESGEIKPLLQIVSGNDYFAQLQQSDPTLAVSMGNFFGGTFNEHQQFSDEKTEEAQQQALIDIGRDSFHLRTSFGTLVAGPIQGYAYALSLIDRTTKKETSIRTWESIDVKSFADELLTELKPYAPMDSTMIDFWKTYLFNQNGMHGFPAIMFFVLQQVMRSLAFDSRGYHLDACLQLLQHALRIKKLEFTYINRYTLRMSWVGEQDQFNCTLQNKYRVDPSLDRSQQVHNFKDVTVTLEKFCIALDAALFEDMGPIEETQAYKDTPTLALTYEKCCDLFWQLYAEYVKQNKSAVNSLITKENDLPALLMRCKESPFLTSRALPEQKNILKALAFHWLQLLNNGQQTVLKKQIQLPVEKMVEKISDQVKILFGLPIVSIVTQFWSTVSASTPSNPPSPVSASMSSNPPSPPSVEAITPPDSTDNSVDTHSLEELVANITLS